MKKTATTIQRSMHSIDAAGVSVGRLASRVASLLRGKHKPTFEYHHDHGDCVEITNIGLMKFTGNKMIQKTYRHYTGYPGGLRTKQAGILMATSPKTVLEHAVWRMLPKNKLRSGMFKRLTIKS